MTRTLLLCAVLLLPACDKQSRKPIKPECQQLYSQAILWLGMKNVALWSIYMTRFHECQAKP